ncbi:MAG: PDZ domain-containing protein [Verrucomicrobiota bacterium]
MNSPHFQVIPVGIAALLVHPVLAIEPPADNAPPPPAAEAPAAPAAQAEAPAQAMPYLGVGTSPVPEVLAAHIGLKANEGIVVRVIDPAGPAAKSGLAQHDVITRVAGQAVGSHAELVRQLQSQHPGDKVALDVIHQGKAVTQSITLAARPNGGGIAAAPQDLDHLMLDGMPQDQAAHIREAIERQLRAMQDGVAIPRGMLAPLPQMDEAMKEMRKRMADGAPHAMDLPKGEIRMQNSAVFRMMDEQGSIEMKSVDGGKEVTLRDKNDKVIWSGPWDTQQDKAAAPPDARARIDKLNLDNNFQGGGFRLHFGPGGQGAIVPDAMAPAAPAPGDADGE